MLGPVVIQSLGLVTGFALALIVTVLLHVDRGAWSVLPVPVIGILSLIPTCILNIYLRAKKDPRSATRSRRRVVIQAASAFSLFVVVSLAAMAHSSMGRVLDDCQTVVGEGRWNDRDVVVVACEASFHEAEQWIELHDASWKWRFLFVGLSGQEPWARRLAYWGARHIYPQPDSDAVFASRPLSAKIEGSTMRIHFENGQGREVDLSVPAPHVCADDIYINAQVHTIGTPEVVEAFSIVDGEFETVGSNEEAMRDACASTRIHDVGGRVVLPGLIDSHAHLTSLGLMDRWLDLRGSASAADVAERVAGVAGDEDDWILGRGWDQTLWSGGYPDRALLDEAAGGRPVYLSRVDGHAAWVSSRALEIAGIDADTPDPEVGMIRRRLDGTPSGILIDSAAEMVEQHVPMPDMVEKQQAVVRAVDKCLRSGLTMIHDAGVDTDIVQIYRELIEEDAFHFRVYAMVCWSCADHEELIEAGPIMGIEDRLWLRAAKLYADGALGSRGASLTEPYSDDPSNSGVLTDEGDLESIVHQAVGKGFQPATHAIGDRANHVMLGIYEGVLQQHPDEDLRLRIEHAQVLAPGDAARLGKLGIIAAMQPTHCTSDMRWAEQRLGPERVKGAYAWRDVLDSGAVLCSGSDFPVESHNPFLGIQAAVTRADLSGSPQGGWAPHQKMTLDEAIASFTIEGARASFLEDRLGSIEPGKLADFIILDQDIYSVDPSQIHSIEPLRTVVGGEIVFEQGALLAEQVTTRILDACTSMTTMYWDREMKKNGVVGKSFDRPYTTRSS